MKLVIALVAAVGTVMAAVPTPVLKGSGDNTYLEVTLERKNAEGRVDREQRWHREHNARREAEASGRRLNGYDFEKNIHNKFNFQYFATFYIGSHMQEMDFILDTGSSWTWIPD